MKDNTFIQEQLEMQNRKLYCHLIKCGYSVDRMQDLPIEKSKNIINHILFNYNFDKEWKSTHFYIDKKETRLFYDKDFMSKQIEFCFEAFRKIFGYDKKRIMFITDPCKDNNNNINFRCKDEDGISSRMVIKRNFADYIIQFDIIYLVYDDINQLIELSKCITNIEEKI